MSIKIGFECDWHEQVVRRNIRRPINREIWPNYVSSERILSIFIQNPSIGNQISWSSRMTSSKASPTSYRIPNNLNVQKIMMRSFPTVYPINGSQFLYLQHEEKYSNHCCFLSVHYFYLRTSICLIPCLQF